KANLAQIVSRARQGLSFPTSLLAEQAETESSSLGLVRRCADTVGCLARCPWGTPSQLVPRPNRGKLTSNAHFAEVRPNSQEVRIWEVGPDYPRENAAAFPTLRKSSDIVPKLIQYRLVRYIAGAAFLADGHVEFVPLLLRGAVGVVLEGVLARKLHHDDVAKALRKLLLDRLGPHAYDAGVLGRQGFGGLDRLVDLRRRCIGLPLDRD